MSNPSDWTIYLYILVAGAVSTLIRVLPSLVIKKKIENQFIQSFLFYLPYITIAVMTFPAIVTGTNYAISGILAMVVGILIAWFGGNLFVVALSCCGIVFFSELLCTYFTYGQILW